VTDIVNGFSNGTLSLSDLESLKVNNPTKYEEVQTAIENKKALQAFRDELY